MSKKKWFGLIAVAVVGATAYYWTEVKFIFSGMSCESLGPMIVKQDFNKRLDRHERLTFIAEIKTDSEIGGAITCYGMGVFGDTSEKKIKFGTEEKYDQLFFYFQPV